MNYVQLTEDPFRNIQQICEISNFDVSKNCTSKIAIINYLLHRSIGILLHSGMKLNFRPLAQEIDYDTILF